MLSLKVKDIDNFKIVSYKRRGWTTIDRDFWLQFHIGSSLLKKYNVSTFKIFYFKKKSIRAQVHGREATHVWIFY